LHAAAQKHLCWIDWFRFVAAFGVVIGHARGVNWVRYHQLAEASRTGLGWLFFVMTHLGDESVLLFFVLSGFLVGGKVLERTINGSFDAKSYAFDRISRIYLPLIPALALTFVINWLLAGSPVSATILAGNLLGLQGVLSVVPAFGGNAPLWTLAYEFWFYILAGCVAVVCVGGGRGKIAGLIGAMAVFCVFTRLHAALLFCWCLGALTYRLIGCRALAWPWFMAGAALAVFGAGFSEFIQAHSAAFGSFLASGQVAALIFCLGAAIVLPYVVSRKPESPRWAGVERIGSRLAAFSYTLYLTHYPLLQLWAKWRPEKYRTLGFGTFPWFVAECLSCLLVAWLIYLPFEAQTQRAREWMRRYVPFPDFRD
jgi:peptidoglycan/LPS O-acetylase OafA/YrhL